MGYAPTPSSRRSSAPSPNQPTPTYAPAEGFRPKSIQSGLTGAVVAFALGRIFVPAAYPELIKANDWWWQLIMRAPGTHPSSSNGLVETLLALPMMLIGLAAMVVLLAAMITLLIASYADRFYLFPVVGFLIGRGAGGTAGRILRAPFRGVGSFLAVFVLSIVDFFRYPKLSHRLASASVLILGVSAFVFVGKVLVPYAQRDSAPKSSGQEVVRYLPDATWIAEGGDDHWRFSLTEVSVHKDYLEATLLAQNRSRRARTLGVDPRTRIQFVATTLYVESAPRLIGLAGEIPMAPALASVGAGAVGTMRLRFERPTIPERLWRMNLDVLNGIERGGAGKGTRYGLEFDLRPAKRSP